MGANLIKAITPVILILTGVSLEVFAMLRNQATQVSPIVSALIAAGAGLAEGPNRSKSIEETKQSQPKDLV